MTNTITFQEALNRSYEPAYQSIIFGALKHLHQRPSQENWDDLVQEARLTLAAKFMSSPDEGVTHSYLYRCIYWRILDLLRRQQRRQSHQVANFDGDHDDSNADCQILQVHDRYEHDQLFSQLKPILTRQQQAYLDLLLRGYSDVEIALRWHCSRQAVNNLRQRIIKKGRQLFQTAKFKQ